MERESSKEEVRRRKSSRRSLLCMALLLVTLVIGFGILQKKHIFSAGPEKSNFIQMPQREASYVHKVDQNEEEWCLTLVNKWNPIKGSIHVKIMELSNGERIDKRIYSYLQKMFDDARQEGIYPIVRSGYRTEQEQKELYDKKIADLEKEGLSFTKAKTEAEYWVAAPGTSEHQLGLAIDINADKIHSQGTDVYAWLEENAHLYGFINRYPSDKTDLTGVANEPWHYRYVGVKAATEIYNKGICLEEYLEQEK